MSDSASNPQSRATRRSPSTLLRVVRRLGRDSSGATAIEFAVVALPFLMLTFGIIGVGLYFFTAFSMEHAVEQASRQIRTGAFKSANSNAGMTTMQFKQSVCDLAPAFVDCNKVRVHVINVAEENNTNAGTKASTGFSGAATRPACTQTNGNLIGENSSTTARVTAAASSIVLVTVCYQFDLAGSIPFLRMGNMTGSSSAEAALIRSAVAFRTEPYE